MSYTQQDLEYLLSKTIDLEQDKMSNELNSKFSFTDSDYDIATPHEVFLLGLQQEKNYTYQSL
jgi:hypothetical protein